MKLVIDIPEHIKCVVDKFKCYGTVAEKEIWKAIKNGTPLEQEPVIDKIRAEIDKIYKREGNSVDCLNALDELKWFIDKYMVESEET